MAIKIKFPELVFPIPFAPKRRVGDKVWFIKQGAWVEGKVISYFCEMSPREEDPKSVQATEISYAVQFWVPNPNGRVPGQPEYIPQVELLEEKAMVNSLDELIELWKQQNVFRLPDGF